MGNVNHNDAMGGGVFDVGSWGGGGVGLGGMTGGVGGGLISGIGGGGGGGVGGGMMGIGVQQQLLQCLSKPSFLPGVWVCMYVYVYVWVASGAGWV
jgi:hypothetical protein